MFSGEAVGELLSPLAADNERVFLILWNEEQFDPAGDARGWLEGYGDQLGDWQYGEVNVLLFDTSPSSD